MESFDGISIMPPVRWNSLDEIISSDACLKSCGGWSNGEAFHTKFLEWLTKMKDVSINELELITFVVALKLWVRQIKNKNVLAYCDNEVSVEIINSGRARNKFSQSCLREICFITAKSNAVLKLVHLAGNLNRISDCLLRFDDPIKRRQFHELSRGVSVQFHEINDDLFRFTHEW